MAHLRVLVRLQVGEGGPLELVRHGVDGWLIPPNDARELARTMLDARGDRSDRLDRERLRRMGEAAYQKVLVEHGAEGFARTVNAMIEGLVDRT